MLSLVTRGGIDQGFHPCLLVLSHSQLFAKNISLKCFLHAQSPLGFDFLHSTVTLACNLHCFVLSLVTRGGIDQGFHPCLLVLSHSHLFAKNISPKCFLHAQSPLGFDFLHSTVTLACNLHCLVLSLVTRGGIEPPLPA